MRDKVNMFIFYTEWAFKNAFLKNLLKKVTWSEKVSSNSVSKSPLLGSSISLDLSVRFELWKIKEIITLDEWIEYCHLVEAFCCIDILALFSKISQCGIIEKFSNVKIIIFKLKLQKEPFSQFYLQILSESKLWFHKKPQ